MCFVMQKKKNVENVMEACIKAVQFIEAALMTVMKL